MPVVLDVKVQANGAPEAAIRGRSRNHTPSPISTREMARTGVPRMKMRLVAYSAQTNSGRRNHVIPGARILWMVTMKLSPVRIDEKPMIKMPSVVDSTCVVDELVLRLGLNLKVYQPSVSPAWLEARHGRLWEQGIEGIERYNDLRKSEPMQRALADLGVGSWFAGLRRQQARSRSAIRALEFRRGRWKMHPIFDWTDRQVFQYLTRHDLPYHPLWHEGYVSIGDWHTTRSLAERRQHCMRALAFLLRHTVRRVQSVDRREGDLLLRGVLAGGFAELLAGLGDVEDVVEEVLQPGQALLAEGLDLGREVRLPARVTDVHGLSSMMDFRLRMWEGSMPSWFRYLATVRRAITMPLSLSIRTTS